MEQEGERGERRRKGGGERGVIAEEQPFDAVTRLPISLFFRQEREERGGGSREQKGSSISGRFGLPSSLLFSGERGGGSKVREEKKKCKVEASDSFIAATITSFSGIFVVYRINGEGGKEKKRGK